MDAIAALWQAITGHLPWWQAVVLLAVALLALLKGGSYLKWWLVIKLTARDAYAHVEEEFGSEYAKSLKQRLYGYAKLGPYLDFIVKQLNVKTGEKFKKSPTAQGIAAKQAAKLAKKS